MARWLLKSEPDVFSYDDLVRAKREGWDGIRNYQARNFMREMKVGDKVLFYASNAKPSGVTGLAVVSQAARPEPSDPTWSMVEIRFVAKFPNVVALETLKETKGLEKMVVTQKGSRLSVQPVTKGEYDIVVKLGRKK